MNWLRGEVTCTASDPICSEKEGSNKAERVWTIQKVDIYPHVHPRALNDCQFYAKYLFEEANTKTINSLSLRKAFYIQMTLPFFFFFEAFIFTSLRFSRVEFYLHLFSLPIFGSFLQKGPLKCSFLKIVTDIEASEISRFREPLHVCNVSAFREKWRKWQSVRNALRIPGFIVQISKLIVPLNKNIHYTAFTTLNN